VGRRFGAGVLAAWVAAVCLAGGSSAMLPWQFVEVTPSGPVPRVVHARAGVTPVAWYGAGLKGHRVVFTGGSCSARVAAPTGERRGCIFRKPGRYVYRLEGVAGHGVVVVTRR
jgi:hypothetical protein